MKYMMMFWVDESGETTADEDAAMMIAVKSWVDQMTERGVLVHAAIRLAAGHPLARTARSLRTRPHWRGALARSEAGIQAG